MRVALMRFLSTHRAWSRSACITASRITRYRTRSATNQATKVNVVTPLRICQKSLIVRLSQVRVATRRPNADPVLKRWLNIGTAAGSDYRVRGIGCKRLAAHIWIQLSH